MQRAHWLAGVATLTAWLGAGAAAAAEAASPPTPSASTVSDVIVTARRVAEDAQKIPVAVTALDSTALVSRNIRTLNDLAAATPDLNLIDAADNASAPAISIRGQGSPDDAITTDPAVGIYLDGVYVPRANGLKLILQDSEEIGQVEVLRGPQGTLFGRNTTGGAFNISSTPPGPAFDAYARGIFGNDSLWDISAGANLPLAPQLALRLAYEHSQHDGYAQDSLGFPQANQVSDFFHARFIARPTDRLTIDGAVNYLRFEQGPPILKLHDFNAGALSSPDPGLQQLAGGVVAEVLAETGLDPSNPANFPLGVGLIESNLGGDAAHNGGAQDSQPDRGGFTHAALTVAYRVSDQLTLKSITGLVQTSRSALLDLDATPYNILSAQVFTRSQAWSEEVQALFRAGPVDGVAGAYFSHEKGEDDEFAAILPLFQLPVIYDGVATNRSDAVFVQANWHATPRLSLTGGFRYTWDSKGLLSFNHAGGAAFARQFVVPTDPNPADPGFGQSILPGFACLITPNLQNVAPGACEAHFVNNYAAATWTGSIGYQFNDDIFAYAKASRGYRGGGENLRGGILTFSAFAPEYATQYEIGVKSTFWDRRARINLAGFYTDYTDIQVNNIIFIPGTNITGTTILNAAKARLGGIEAEAVALPVRHLTIGLTANWFSGKYTRYDYLGVDETSQPWGPPDYTLDILGRYELPVAIGAVSAQADYYIAGRQPLSLGDITACVPSGGRCLYDTSQIVWGKTLGNLSARLSLHVAAWRSDLSLWARNLTNQRLYYELLGPVDTRVFNVGYLNDPRTFGVEISKHF